MDDCISISLLNDFIFCPYSIYLHNVYMDTDEGLYHAKPQIKGRIAHESIDNKTLNKSKGDLLSLSVYSSKYGLVGKIDVYRQNEKLLIERKYQLKQIYQGHIYQLWAQYFCMQEMGYEIEKIAFYEISTNRMLYINLPTSRDIDDFVSFIEKFKSFNPNTDMYVNANKCKHCIYCNLCDRTYEENVY